MRKLQIVRAAVLSCLLVVAVARAAGAQTQTRAECLQAANAALDTCLPGPAANYMSCETGAISTRTSCYESANSAHAICHAYCWETSCTEVVFDCTEDEDCDCSPDPCGCDGFLSGAEANCDADYDSRHTACRERQIREEGVCFSRYQSQIDACPAE